MPIDGDRRVPLQVGWLSENGILTEAAELVGYKVNVKDKASINEKGIWAIPHSSPDSLFLMEWGDHLMFTLNQLEQLGFLKE